MAAQEQMAAWIGLDWAEDQHEIRLRVAGRPEVESSQVKQQAEALHDWIAQLRARFGGRPVAIALEQKRGGLMAALMSYEFLHLYPINPRTLSSYRQAFCSSGKKDDPLDADLLLELVYSHGDRLRRWRPETVATRQLQLLTEDRRKWVEQRKRFVQQLTQALKSYYPQVLEWFEDVNRPEVVEFLRRYPTLEKARRAGSLTLSRLLAKQGVRQAPAKAAHLRQQMRASLSLTQDPALIQAGASKVLVLVGQLQALLAAIRSYDKQIARLFAQHPDAPLFESFHGAGAALAPRLLAALGTDRSRFAQAGEVQQYSGIAPVTRRSGRCRQVTWRRGCPKFVRQTFHEFAACSISKSRWARAYYTQQRRRGLKHQAAVRALAYKWIRILFRCWKNRTPYDEQRYCQSLEKRNSPLIHIMQELEACA